TKQCSASKQFLAGCESGFCQCGSLCKLPIVDAATDSEVRFMELYRSCAEHCLYWNTDPLSDCNPESGWLARAVTQCRHLVWRWTGFYGHGFTYGIIDAEY